mgnify:FL=1
MTISGMDFSSLYKQLPTMDQTSSFVKDAYAKAPTMDQVFSYAKNTYANAPTMDQASSYVKNIYANAPSMNKIFSYVKDLLDTPVVKQNSEKVLKVVKEPKNQAIAAGVALVALAILINIYW